MMSLYQVPGVDVRLQSHVEVMELAVRVTDLLRQVRTLRAAILAIKGSAGVCQFLLVMLGVGNYMGAQKKGVGGRAALSKNKEGVTMEVMSAFELQRAVDGKSNLVQWLIKIFQQLTTSGARDIFTAMAQPVRSASTIDPVVLEASFIDVREKMAALTAAVASVAPCSALIGSPEVEDCFHHVMEVAIKDVPCAALELEFGALGEEFQAIAVHFCFDPLMFSFDRTPMEEFFNGMLELADMYEKAADKVQQQNRLQEMKARRLAAREAKLQKAAAKPKRGTHSLGKGNSLKGGKGGKGLNEIGKGGSTESLSIGKGGKATSISTAPPGRGKGSNNTSGKGGNTGYARTEVAPRFAAIQNRLGAVLCMDE